MRSARALASLVAFVSTIVIVSNAARAQPPPPPAVDVRVEGVFGNDALLGDGYASVAVTLRNTTRETFRGRILLSTQEWNQAPERHELSLDLPGGQVRRAVMTLFLGGAGASIEARYDVDGATLGSASQGTAYAPGGGSLVLVTDPPRLRANLLDLQVSIPDPGSTTSYGSTATGSERAIAVPVGLTAIDATTGDPILPDDALGWSTVAVAVVAIPMLARISPAQLQGLRDWVYAGGHVVLAPRTDSDLTTPLVRELLGEIRLSETWLVPSPFVPAGEIRALSCGERATEERFGCAARAGHGMAHVLAYDATSPPYAERPETRELLRAIVHRALRSPGPRLALGRGRDQFSQDWYAATPTFSRLRAALDPNEGYRPALGLVGIVLFLYVIVVGPMNFRFVLRRNTPTLALVTTPLAALACVLVMLFVGYLGKGVLTRYRRVEVIDAIEGSALAPSRAYTSLFLTRPSTVELTTPPRARTMRVTSGGSDDGLVIRHGGERPRLTGLRGGLWESLFFRTDRVLDLGGAPSFAYEENRLVAITNGTRHALRSAFIVDETNVYVIGDVEPGATRPIPRTPASFLAGAQWYDEATDPLPGQLATQLGLDAADTSYVRGVLRLLGTASDPSEPLLWARIDPDDAPETSPSFAREQDLRVLLLRARPSYDGLVVPPPPVQDGTIWGTPPPLPDPVLPPAPNGPVPPPATEPSLPPANAPTAPGDVP